MCSSRDEDGKGSVSPSLLAGGAYRKKGYKASMARCPTCSMLPGGRGDAGVPSPQLPPYSSCALRLHSLLPVYTRIFSLVSAMWSQPPGSSSQCFLQKDKHPTAPWCCELGSWLLAALGGWQEAGDVFLPPKQLFFFQNFFAGEKNQVENFH